MKKKLIMLVLTSSIIVLTFFVSFFIEGTTHTRIVLAVEVLVVTFLLLYLFGGIGKLVSSIIYGMVIALFLFFFPKYDTAFIFIGTFIFALNPLSDLEDKIEKSFPEEKSIFRYVKGTYLPYHDYRKEVKNYYHLPQVRKVYTKPGYLKTRQALSILMSMIAIFLLIREVNNLINLLKNFNIHIFFASTYSVIILVLLTILLYKKGFQSMVNFLTVSIFPPMAYFMILRITPNYLGNIIGVVIIFLGIFVSIFQYLAYRNRIVFEYYYYYDNNKQREVYANALFEPFVYSEDYYLATSFKIKTNILKFNKAFHSIVVYADYNRFFITSYTNNRNEIVIYTDFHHRDVNKIDKFKRFLESIFEETVITDIVIDTSKKFYEENFFHQNDYIVARTLYLSELLKKLEIKSSVIISLVAYFKDIQDINNLSKNYMITRLPEYDMNEILTVRIDTRVNNIDYVIEAKVRDLLLDLLINKGTYVRISVYY